MLLKHLGAVNLDNVGLPKGALHGDTVLEALVQSISAPRGVGYEDRRSSGQDCHGTLYG